MEKMTLSHLENSMGKVQVAPTIYDPNLVIL